MYFSMFEVFKEAEVKVKVEVKTVNNI